MGMKDVTGQRFGRLEAVSRTDRKDRWGRCYLWSCRCDCGHVVDVPLSLLRNGIVRSCGCFQAEARRKDIAGERRGRLTAVKRIGVDERGKSVWLWKCDCGNEFEGRMGKRWSSQNPMCEECLRRQKAGQADTMRDQTERYEPTGASMGTVTGIREGKLSRNNTSGVRGVRWHNGNKAWVAVIHQDGKVKTLGYFKTIEEAAAARRAAVLERYGSGEDDQTTGGSK